MAKKPNPLDEFIEISTDSRKSRGLPSPYTKRETLIQECGQGAGLGATAVSEFEQTDPRGIHQSKLQGPDDKNASGVGAMNAESVQVMQKLTKEQLQFGKEDYLQFGIEEDEED
jgi:hypothetical protein